MEYKIGQKVIIKDYHFGEMLGSITKIFKQYVEVEYQHKNNYKVIQDFNKRDGALRGCRDLRKPYILKILCN